MYDINEFKKVSEEKKKNEKKIKLKNDLNKNLNIIE